MQGTRPQKSNATFRLSLADDTMTVQFQQSVIIKKGRHGSLKTRGLYAKDTCTCS